MTTERFAQLLERSGKRRTPILLDGAIGTMLDEWGLLDADTPWSGMCSIRHPGALRSLHELYIDAGADVITTCTFRTSETMFRQYGYEDDTWKIAAVKAVHIARQTAESRRVLVAGSVGPLNDCFSDNFQFGVDEAEQRHLPLMSLLAASGVDVLWLETFGHRKEIEGALRAAKRISINKNIPFVLSVTTKMNGMLLDGCSLQEISLSAKKCGCAALLVNCIPPSHVSIALTTLRGGMIPYGVYANLGVPEANQDWEGNAFMTPEQYTTAAQQWMNLGIQIIGACCGSRPEHIASLNKMIHSSI